MRVIRRIPTAKQQTDQAWRAIDKPTRQVLRELARLGYDVNSVSPVDGEDDEAASRIYLTGVGARALNVVLRVAADGRVTRVAVGHESFTVRQALLWLRKRAARERRYLP
jgi:peptidoglycan hydrolase-like protein with peptidoglycan-binding domain